MSERPGGFTPEGKLSRRDLLKLGLSTIPWLIQSGDRSRTAEIKEEEETSIPGFILEQSAEEKESKLGPEVIEAIDQAWELLDEREAGYKFESVPIRVREGKRRRPRTRRVNRLRYNVLLAAMNTMGTDRNIEFVKVDEHGQPDRQGFSIDSGPRRGVGTRYEVTSPRGFAVLGIKRVLQFGNRYEEVIYTPYSSSLDILPVRKEGFLYLTDQISEAQKDLRQRGVRSKAFPGKLVSDVMPLPVSTQLSIIEHVDPFDFEARAKALMEQQQRGRGMTREAAEKEVMKQMAREVLTAIGANREFSYRYAVSPAGARDLFQFIPRTYRNIRNMYPQAGLNRDFVQGMMDHKNGAKASLLLFDSDLSFTNPQHREFLVQHPEALGIYLASAYNGGVGRTVGAINKYGEKWPEHVLPETITYIRKFKALAAAFEER